MKLRNLGRPLFYVFSVVFIFVISLVAIKKPQTYTSEAKGSKTCWLAFGPKGEPAESWNTVEEFLQVLNDNKIQATEVYRWVSQWEGHVFQLPFNDFSLEVGTGYLVKLNHQGPRNLYQNLQYSPVGEHVYQLTTGWNLISLPEDVYQGLKKKYNVVTGETFCKTINQQGGNITEVYSQKECSSILSNKYQCNENAHSLIIQPGKAYFIKTTKSSSWQLP